MLQLCGRSIEEKNAQNETKILEYEAQINKTNQWIQDKVLELFSYEQLANQQTRGLFIFAKTARELERVGDHTINIIVTGPSEKLPEAVSSLFSQLLLNISEMFNALSTGIKEEDRSTLQWICDEDEQVNRLNRKAFEQITYSLTIEQLQAESGGKLILMSRFFERLADHIANAAKDYRRYLKECHPVISKDLS